MNFRRPYFFLIAAAAAAAAFAPSLSGGFLWDDEFLIVHNPLIRSLSHLPGAWTKEFFSGAFETVQITFYRPLVTTLNMFQYTLFGLRPFWWRLFNTVLHSLNAALLFQYMTRRLGLGAKAALMGTLFFAVHPVQSEAVCFISGRTDLMAFSLVMGALLLAGGTQGGWRATVAGSALFGMALFAKETVIVAPAVILMERLFLSPKDDRAGLIHSRTGRTAGLWLGMALAFIIIRFMLIKGTGSPGYPSGAARSTWLTMPAVFLRYAKLVVLPTGLLCDYTNYFRIVTSPLTVSFAWHAGAFLGIMALILIPACRRHKTGVGFLWYFLFLAPVLNIFPLGLWMAERYLYIPMAGLGMVAGVCVETLSGRFHMHRRIVYGVSAVFLLALFSGSVARSLVWRDSLTLWEEALRVHPDNPQAAVIYGQVLASRGRNSDAERVLLNAKLTGSQSLELQRQQTLVKIRTSQGRFEEALGALRQARSLLPQSAWNDVLEGRLFQAEGRIDEAERAFTCALLKQPAMPAGLLGILGLQVERDNDPQKILEIADQLIAAAPETGFAHMARGRALWQTGRYDEAEGALFKALMLMPEEIHSRLLLADIYERRGAADPAFLKKAEDLYRQILSIRQDEPAAMNNLAILRAKAGDGEEARRLWNRVLEINPEDAEAAENLSRLTKP
ncbi:MAG TPA: tetratricopeptide repeat protein [Candidatus Sumerlaeota bacterium]|nr:tetratricopeptide repeat protein [Candidatus Sumerlaeota bacterium]